MWIAEQTYMLLLVWVWKYKAFLVLVKNVFYGALLNVNDINYTLLKGEDFKPLSYVQFQDHLRCIDVTSKREAYTRFLWEMIVKWNLGRFLHSIL